MRLRVRETELFIQNLRTRMPFRYGIATMTSLPHAILRLTLEIDGVAQIGCAADNLPPKWFTKNPETTFQQEVEEQLEVIRHTCAIALQMEAVETVFAWWQRANAAQKEWAGRREIPPLLSGFGVSLVERAILDAFCRARCISFAEAVRADHLGLRLAALYPELAGCRPADFLPARPLEHLILRHTIGLTDPLADAEIAPGERIRDGLPQSFEATLREDGITHFKIKLGGDLEADRARLLRIADIAGRDARDFRFTLDGNENYHAVAPFRALWESLRGNPAIAPFLARLIFVEQPLHRSVALTAQTAEALLAWSDRPPIIIDESDAEAGTLAVALASGYAGVSHKNCKGVFKGIANACLIAHRQRGDPANRLHMSAEDLTCVGPLSLLQDLAAVATLGIAHSERNGHHYFAGLSQFPRSMQDAVVSAHGDLYTRHGTGFPTVRIEQGKIAIRSVVAAPFGLAPTLDFSGLTPVDDWSFDSLES